MLAELPMILFIFYNPRINSLQHNKAFVKTPKRNMFIIEHFAGQVEYDISGFIKSNERLVCLLYLFYFPFANLHKMITYPQKNKT